MLKQFFWTICYAAIFLSCHQFSKHDKALVIDPSIKNEVDKYITKYTDSLQPGPDSLFYSNKYMVELFYDDTLSKSTYGKPNTEPFRSNYSWLNDTLIINGSFGLFEDIGFEVKINSDTVTVFGILKNNLGYKNSINDTITPYLMVPTTGSKLILSEIPTKEDDRLLYGYIEFKQSNVFFQIDNENYRVRQNMKAYFKSEKLK